LVSNSSYISTEHIEKTIDSGKCHCELCKSMAQRSYINGKPLIELKELEKIQETERRAKENIKNIKISKITNIVTVNYVRRAY
jgi:hypothetical protein